jgi:hypothetical protein
LVGVAVAVGVGVFVGPPDGVGVLVGVGVGVFVGAPDGVGVLVGVGVGVGVSVGVLIGPASFARTLANPDGGPPSMTVSVSLAATALVARPAIRTKTIPQATAIVHCQFFKVLNN